MASSNLFTDLALSKPTVSVYFLSICIIAMVETSLVIKKWSIVQNHQYLTSKCLILTISFYCLRVCVNYTKAVAFNINFHSKNYAKIDYWRIHGDDTA